MTDVVLIQPRTGSWDNLGTRIPESLLSMAAVLIEKGYNIELIDQRIETEWKNRLKALLKDNLLLVGMSCMTGPQITYALEISEFVKNINHRHFRWLKL